MENKGKLIRTKLPEHKVLQQNLNDVEQRALANNLEIIGLTEKKTEVLAPLLCKIASVLGVTVTGKNIDSATALLPDYLDLQSLNSRLRDSLFSAI